MLASYPYHARLLETIVHTGLWAAYEAWKTMLVERVEHHRHEGLTVVLHDFSAYHTYAAELCHRRAPGPCRAGTGNPATSAPNLGPGCWRS